MITACASFALIDRLLTNFAVKLFGMSVTFSRKRAISLMYLSGFEKSSFSNAAYVYVPTACDESDPDP